MRTPSPGAGLDKVCALITDGRFSGGSSGISVGHFFPEAAAGGVIGLIEDGDTIVLDVANRPLEVHVADELLAERHAKMEASERPWQPRNRDRQVTKALRAYAALTTSADKAPSAAFPEMGPSGITAAPSAPPPMSRVPNLHIQRRTGQKYASSSSTSPKRPR